MDGTIGIFVNAVDGYQGCIVREVQEAAAAEGLAVEVFDADHNAPKQAQDMVRFAGQHTGKRVCAFLLPEADAVGESGADPMQKLAMRIVDKGVGLVVLNHGREDMVASLRSAHPELPVTLVAVDNVEFGRVQGRQLLKLAPSGGTVLYLRGNPADSACRDRARGTLEELHTAGGFSLGEITAHWAIEFAEEYVHKWITSPMRRQTKLAAVVAQNDHMGRGARQALETAAGELGRPDLRNVPIIGGDGLPEFGLRWLSEGVLTCTVSVVLPGRRAVEELARCWRDGTPLAPVTKLPVRSHPELATIRPS